MNSIAQQAVPKGSGHKLFFRAHASIASSLVVSSAELPSGWRIQPPGGSITHALYVVLSHGKQGRGGFAFQRKLLQLEALRGNFEM